jgi:hypothetical protein
MSLRRSSVHKNWYSTILIFWFIALCKFSYFIFVQAISPIKAMDMNLHRMIDLIKKKCSAQELVLCISYFFELLPFVNFHTLFLSGPFLLKYKAMDLKLHRMIDLIKKKCSAQELVLYNSYILSFCPLLIFILYFCLGHFS